MKSTAASLRYMKLGSSTGTKLEALVMRSRFERKTNERVAGEERVRSMEATSRLWNYWKWTLFGRSWAGIVIDGRREKNTVDESEVTEDF